MSKKDIALTVGGILATMLLAYLFYKRQQEAAAAAGSAAPGSQSLMDVNDPANYYDQTALFNASMQYSYGYNLASLSVPTFNATGAGSTSAPAVDVSSSTAAGQEAGPGAVDVITGLFHDYMSQAAQPHSADFSTLVIPALNIAPGIDTSGIPVTAAQAAAGLGAGAIDNGHANIPAWGEICPAWGCDGGGMSVGVLSTGGVDAGAVAPGSTLPVGSTIPAATQTNAAHYNHVLQQSAA